MSERIRKIFACFVSSTVKGGEKKVKFRAATTGISTRGVRVN